jgi:transcription elongation factor GreB
MSKAFTRDDEAALTDDPLDAEPERRRGPRYITVEGYKRLREELERIWKVERPRVTEEVSAAAELGDRSENAEYIYGKRKLRELDRRIRYLSRLLESLTVVEPKPSARAHFGAWVSFEDEEGAESTYRIVGADEMDVSAGTISVDSPVGKALLGKGEGDEARVLRPRGTTLVTITRIRYQRP